MNGTNNNKKDAIFKAAMTAVAALFLIALYFNNKTAIAKIADRKRGVKAESVSGEAANAQPLAPAEAAPEAPAEQGGGARAPDFALRGENGENGKDRLLSDFRGDIVFLVFWDPADAGSAEPANSFTAARSPDGGSPLDAARAASGGYKVDLLCVRVGSMGGGQTGEAGGGGAPGAGTAGGGAPGAGTTGGGAHEADAAGGDTPETGGVYRFADAGSELKRRFSVESCPVTYVFYPSGELCDYHKGDVDPARAGRLAAKASKGSRGAA